MNLDHEPARPRKEPAKLPVGSIAVGAWKALREDWDILATLATLGFLPVLVILLWEPLFVGLLGLEGAAERVASWAVLGLGWVAPAYVASHWHRLILLGRENVRATLPRWTRGETRLFWWSAGFAVLSWIAAFLLVLPLGFLDLLFESLPGLTAWVPRLVPWAFMVGTSYLGLRFCLAFPAAAVGGPSRGFPDSWRATSRNGWRLVAATALALLPLLPPLVLALHLVTLRGVRAIAGAALGTAVYFLMLVTLAGVLSLAYRHLILSGGAVPDRSQDESDRPDPAAETGVRSLAPRAGLFEETPDEGESPPAVRF